MNAFTSWILGIAGIIILGLLVDLILPNGHTSKYIKSIFSILIIFVIISPLAKLKNSSFTLSDLFNNDITIDETFVAKINSARLEQITKSVTEELKEYGLTNVELQFDTLLENSTFNIEKVTINLKNLVIAENFKHIDKYKLLVQVVQKYVNIKEEDVIFYE